MAVPAALGLDPATANSGTFSKLTIFDFLFCFCYGFYLLIDIHFIYLFCFVVHQVINNTVGSILPSTIQKTLLDGIFSLGRAQLSDFVLNENNPLGSSRLAKVRRIFEEGKSLQLQFPAEDLGFRYDLYQGASF